MRWFLSFLLLLLVSGVGCDAKKIEEPEAEKKTPENSAQEEGPRLSKVGENCVKTEECKASLQCVEQKCQPGEKVAEALTAVDAPEGLGATGTGAGAGMPVGFDEFEDVVSFGPEGLGVRGTGAGGNVISGDTDLWHDVHMRVNTDSDKKAAESGAKMTIGSGKTANTYCKKNDLRKVIRRRGEAIRGCYENRLLSEPDLKGQLTVRWTLDPAGKVHRTAIIDKSLNDTAVEDCVLRVARRTRFKKPAGGYCVFQWPFVFGSN